MTRCHPPEFERACLIDTKTVKISMSFLQDRPQFCLENERFELFLFILIAIYGQRYDIHRHQICINKIFDISTIILVAFIEEKVPNTLSVSCFIMTKFSFRPFWTPSWTPMPKDDTMLFAGI